MLPEPPANGEERVIIHDDRAILRAGRDGRAGKLAVNFTGVSGQALLDRLYLVRLLRQDDAASHGLHIEVGQLNRDGEPSTQALQQRFSEVRVDYTLLDTSKPLDHALYKYLGGREKRMRRR